MSDFDMSFPRNIDVEKDPNFRYKYIKKFLVEKDPIKWKKDFKKWAKYSVWVVLIVVIIFFIYQIHDYYILIGPINDELTNAKMGIFIWSCILLSHIIFICLYLIFCIGCGSLYASINRILKSGKYGVKHRKLNKLCVYGLRIADLSYKRNDEKRQFQLTFPHGSEELIIFVNVDSDRFRVSSSYGWIIPDDKFRTIVEFVERINTSEDIVKLHLDYIERKIGTESINYFGRILDYYDVKTVLVNIIELTRKLYENCENPLTNILHNDCNATTAYLEFEKISKNKEVIQNA